MATTRIKDADLEYTKLFGDEQFVVDSDKGTGRASIDVLVAALFERASTMSSSDLDVVVRDSLVRALNLNPAAPGLIPALTGALTAAFLQKANAANAQLTGVPTAPTAALGTNTNQIATMAAIQAALSNLVAGAPGFLDTFDELAAAIGDDPNFATTILTGLAARLRVDAAQSLTSSQQDFARGNLGLNTSRALASGANLDTVSNNGVYQGANLVNAPTVGQYYVQVFNYTFEPTNYVMQQAWSLIGDAAAAYFIRSRVNGIWGVWIRMPTIDDVNLRLSVATSGQNLTPTQIVNALTNLGVSAFVRSLLDDADAKTFLRTIAAGLPKTPSGLATGDPYLNGDDANGYFLSFKGTA